MVVARGEGTSEEARMGKFEQWRLNYIKIRISGALMHSSVAIGNSNILYI